MSRASLDGARGPSATQTAGEIHSYHGQPVIKQPVWEWEIPLYFFMGGMAGASSGLAYGAELRGNAVLARRSWTVALGAVSTSPFLLIADLGKPIRFLHMLRMFKVTSPMSVGSWILSVSGTSIGLATVNEFTGLFPRLARLAKPAAVLSGLPLSTYTAALIANTAIPVWHEARRELPYVFAAGAALSAAAGAIASTPPDHARPARRLALASALAEVALEKTMEARLGEHREPYERGLPRRLALLSRVTIAGGSLLLAGPGRRSRAAAAGASVLMLAGALSTRWSIFRAGFDSAANPRYTVAPQRERIRRGERAGAARSQSRVSEPQHSAGSPALDI